MVSASISLPWPGSERHTSAGSYLISVLLIQLTLAQLITSNTAVAQTLDDQISSPFYIANRSPLMANSGIHAPESAQLLSVKQYTIDVFMDVISNATQSLGVEEDIILDGETGYADLRIRYGISEKWEVGADLVWLNHSGGELDGLINNWHEVFGLPGGDRNKQPEHRLMYNYQQDGETVLDLQKDSNGIGDVRLSAAYQVSSNNNSQMAIRGGIELATGDSDELLGSGSVDWYLELINTRRMLLAKHWLTLHSGIGILLPGDGEILANQQRDQLGYGFVSLDWRVSEAIHLKLQLNGHTSPYRSQTSELDHESALLIVGGTLMPLENWLLDISVAEDLIGESPDISFQIGIRHQLDANRSADR